MWRWGGDAGAAAPGQGCCVAASVVAGGATGGAGGGLLVVGDSVSRSSLLLLSLCGRVDLRAKALHAPLVRADDGGASWRRSPSCWRRCGVVRLRPMQVVLEVPGENLSSVGSGRRQRTRCYLVGGVSLEPFSSCGAAGSWRLGAVTLWPGRWKLGRRPRMVVVCRGGGLGLLCSDGHMRLDRGLLCSGGNLELCGQRVCRPGWIVFGQCKG